MVSRYNLPKNSPSNLNVSSSDLTSFIVLTLISSPTPIKPRTLLYQRASTKKRVAPFGEFDECLRYAIRRDLFRFVFVDSATIIIINRRVQVVIDDRVSYLSHKKEPAWDRSSYRFYPLSNRAYRRYCFCLPSVAWQRRYCSYRPSGTVYRPIFGETARWFWFRYAA